MTESRIYDKTDERLWSNNIKDWEEEFNQNDVIISIDGTETLGKTTYVVSRINFYNPADYVERLGMFWRKREASRFAEKFCNDVNKMDREESIKIPSVEEIAESTEQSVEQLEKDAEAYQTLQSGKGVE